MVLNGLGGGAGEDGSEDLRFIFDQWPNSKIGLDALSNQRILKGI